MYEELAYTSVWFENDFFQIYNEIASISKSFASFFLTWLSDSSYERRRANLQGVHLDILVEHLPPYIVVKKSENFDKSSKKGSDCKFN